MFPCEIYCEPDNDPTYRYRYEMVLAEHDTGNWLTVILKNPSTADCRHLDATTGKIAHWAIRRVEYNYTHVVVVNLFARRATRPADLKGHSYTELVGPANDDAICEAVLQAHVVVAGWGAPNGLDPIKYRRRVDEVLALLGDWPLHTVGPLTYLGYPRHGLDWNTDCALSLWAPER